MNEELKQARKTFDVDKEKLASAEAYGSFEIVNTTNIGQTVALVEDIVVEYVTDMDTPKLNRCTELLSMNGELKQARKAFDADGEKLASAEAYGSFVIVNTTNIGRNSMGILKEYITKHNVPNDVPDDAEILSKDDDENAQRSVVTRTNVKPPTLAAYTGVVPLIAKICQPKNWKKKKKKASLEEKSHEMWKREFFTGRKM
nr:transcription initiation factor TFIID subunit 13 [Tanacetum cinerariifolium]